MRTSCTGIQLAARAAKGCRLSPDSAGTAPDRAPRRVMQVGIPQSVLNYPWGPHLNLASYRRSTARASSSAHTCGTRAKRGGGAPAARPRSAGRRAVVEAVQPACARAFIDRRYSPTHERGTHHFTAAVQFLRRSAPRHAKNFHWFRKNGSCNPPARAGRSRSRRHSPSITARSSASSVILR